MRAVGKDTQTIREPVSRSAHSWVIPSAVSEQESGRDCYATCGVFDGFVSCVMMEIQE